MPVQPSFPGRLPAAPRPGLPRGRARRLARAATGVLILASVPGHAAERPRDPVKAAQAVALARLAPGACDDVVADDHAIRSFMTLAGVSEADLTGRYAEAVGQAVQAFRDSLDRDEDAACSQIARRLGQEGLGLVGEAGMGEP